MTQNAWLALLQVVLIAGAALSVFICRNWIKARIDRSVQFTFDAKLEVIRAEFRGIEERLRSDLRQKEAEIAALRDGVLSGRAGRQTLLAKRRIEAVERLWAAAMKLGPYRAVAALMVKINIDYASEQAPTNPSVRKFVETIANVAPEIKRDNELNASAERPFLSPMAWAYFSALSTTLIVIYAQAKAIEFGFRDSVKLIDLDGVRGMLKKALPHQSNLIDQWGLTNFFFFIEELEELLLKELVRMLDGADLDAESMSKSTEIIKSSRKVIADLEEQTQTVV